MDISGDIFVNTTVVRAVDENGSITDDPAKVVEGELRLTRADGTWEIVNVFRRIEQRRGNVSA